MDARAQLLVLSEIGKLDLKLLTSKESQNRLGRESTQANDQAVKLGLAMTELEAKKADALVRKKGLDERLSEERGKLRKWETRAEKIRGEREYSALISEISALRRGITGLEAELSEVITELKGTSEKLEKASGDQAKNINIGTDALEGVKELLDQESANFQTIEHAKSKLLEQLPTTLVNRYYKIREKRGDLGVAFLENEVCLACRRKVPAELFLKVAKGEVIEQCPSCNRLLVATDMSYVKTEE
jgi:predicted  nucleic acid-binding Zn-ribbon protein